MRLEADEEAAGVQRIAVAAAEERSEGQDIGIALELAGEAGLLLPLAMLVSVLEDRLIAAGHGDEDMSVIARAIRELAVTEPTAVPGDLAADAGSPVGK